MQEESQQLRIDGRLALTTAEAAQALGISERKLWSLTNMGQIPSVRFGKSVRYPVDGLRRWLDKQTRGGRDGE